MAARPDRSPAWPVVPGADAPGGDARPCRSGRRSSRSHPRGPFRGRGRRGPRTSRPGLPRGRTTSPPARRRRRPRGCPCDPSAIPGPRGRSACPEAPPRAPAPGRAARRRRPASPARSSPPPRNGRMHAGRPEGRGGRAQSWRRRADTGAAEPDEGRCCPRFCRASDHPRDVGTGPPGHRPSLRKGVTPSGKALK